MELLLPLLVLLLLVPLFLSVRRQKKEVDRQRTLQDSLKVGDRVMTTSGLYGDVVALTDTTVELEIAPGVVTSWLRMVIRDIVTDEEQSDSADVADAEGNLDSPEGFDQRGTDPGRQ